MKEISIGGMGTRNKDLAHRKLNHNLQTHTECVQVITKYI